MRGTGGCNASLLWPLKVHKDGNFTQNPGHQGILAIWDLRKGYDKVTFKKIITKLEIKPVEIKSYTD